MSDSWANKPESNLPTHYFHWLTKITRLSHHYEMHGAIVNLAVLNMHIDTLRSHEAHALALSSRPHLNNDTEKNSQENQLSQLDDKPLHQGFVRETIITNQSDGTVLSHARVCACSEDKTTIDQLHALDTKLIGESMLHHDQSIHRSQFQFRQAAFADAQKLGPQVKEDLSTTPSSLDSISPWSRYSIFSRADKLWLVITETLSPALNQWHPSTG